MLIAVCLYSCTYLIIQQQSQQQEIEIEQQISEYWLKQMRNQTQMKSFLYENRKKQTKIRQQDTENKYNKRQQNQSQLAHKQKVLLQRWLIQPSLSSCQQTNSKHYQYSHQYNSNSNDSLNRDMIDCLFKTIQQDQKSCNLFISNLQCLLRSNQVNAKHIFDYCVNKVYDSFKNGANGKQLQTSIMFYQQIRTFLIDYMNQKNQLVISPQLQHYLLHVMWKQQFKIFTSCKNNKIVNNCNEQQISSYQIIQHLSLKMRSLDASLRFQAVCVLFNIVQYMNKNQQNKQQSQNNQDIISALKHILPQMIQKQIYGKEVCYSRGVLLQILQDQHCHIKKKGIELLGQAEPFLNPTIIRPLLLYMLNDQHQPVRETCLTVLSQIPSLDIEKQDLVALLVCLKQNNSLMRNYTYQSLSHINITSARDFMVIFNRLLSILSSRSEDKRRIYLLCSKLGKKYPNFVLQNQQSIYNYSSKDEPNWKSASYRTRFITVAFIGEQNWPLSLLPDYFLNHYLYICDVLPFLFKSKNQSITMKYNTQESQKTKLEYPLGQQQQMHDERQYNLQNHLNIQNDYHFYLYLKATYYTSKGLLKDILSIAIQWVGCLKLSNNELSQYQIHKQQHQNQIVQMCKNITLQWDRLKIAYNIYKDPNAKSVNQFMNELCNIFQIKQQNVFQEKEENNIKVQYRARTQLLKKLITTARQNSIFQILEKVECILFRASNVQKGVIIISNVPQVLKHSFIQLDSSTGDNQRTYLRMSQVDFEQQDDKVCHFRINFKSKHMKCFIVYGQQCHKYITYQSSQHKNKQFEG